MSNELDSYKEIHLKIQSVYKIRGCCISWTSSGGLGWVQASKPDSRVEAVADESSPAAAGAHVLCGRGTIGSV